MMNMENILDTVELDQVNGGAFPFMSLPGERAGSKAKTVKLHGPLEALEAEKKVKLHGPLDPVEAAKAEEEAKRAEYLKKNFFRGLAMSY